MFTYRCLECGKKHVSQTPFVEDSQADCFRCGRSVSLTRESVQPMAVAATQVALEKRPAEASTTQALDRSAKKEQGITTAVKKGSGKTASNQDRPRPNYLDISDEAADAVEIRKPADEDSEEGDAPDKAGKKPKKGSPSPKKKSSGKPWLLMVAITAPILIAMGGGLYWFLGSSGKPKIALNKTPPPPPPQPDPVTPPPVKVVTPKPVAVVPIVPIAFLSAPRLASEIAANPAATDRKYHDSLLQVSGVFDRAELPKPAPSPPPAAPGQPATAPVPRVKSTAPVLPLLVYFQTDKGAIACSPSTSPTEDVDRWKTLRKGTPLTVRGKYSKGGLLLACEWREHVAPADVKYKGKVIEIAGAVEGTLLPGAGTDYPTIRLARETDSKLEVEFLFDKADREVIQRITPGTRVTIRGTCGGRTDRGGKVHIRFDNCRLTQTTAPEATVPRMSAVDFAREYEEDLRGDFLPPQGEEERHETPITVTQLSKDWKADRTSLLKYRNKILTASGRIASRDARQVVLESRETDQPLRVVCLFAPGTVPDFADLPEIRIQGLCRIAQGTQMLRLDNCTADLSQVRKAVPMLTADYLPHVPGTPLIYDFALFPPAVKGSPVVSRYLWFQREGGVTETMMTHNGRLTAKSLLGSAPSDDWVSNPRTKKGRSAGPVYIQREFDGMVGQGPRGPKPQGNTPEVLEPALKVGAKVGDSWTFTRNNAKHVYTLERFDTWRGRPSAVVAEVIVTPLPGDYQREVRHVYARGIGEVERQEWLRITSTERKVIAEKKILLLEDLSFRGPRLEQAAPMPPETEKKLP